MHRTIPLLLFLAALAAPSVSEAAALVAPGVSEAAALAAPSASEAAALAAPSASQAAIRTVDYQVVIAGTADYNRADADEEASAQHDETVDFRTTIPKLTFHGRVADDSTGALGTATVRRGSYLITGASGQVRCSSHAVQDVTGGGLDATFAQDRTVFAARVIDAVTIAVGGCDLAGMGTWTLPLTSGGDEVGIGLFDGSFTVPHERIGEATMSFPLHGEVTGASCPMHHARTVLCSLTWDATVTFTRTGEGEEATPEDDLLVPLVAKAKLTQNLSRASLPLACATACRGTLSAAAGGKTLAKQRFAIDAGRPGRAIVRFTRADRGAIRRAGRVRLTLKASGGGQTVRRTVTLRAR